MKPQIITSSTSAIELESDGEPCCSIDDKLKQRYESVILGFFHDPKTPMKSSSAVSVALNTNQVDVAKARRDLTKKHPLRNEEPEKWNNIPVCIAESVGHIIQWIVEGDESLFSYQQATNNRIFKLQEQISQIKGRMKSAELQTEQAIESLRGEVQQKVKDVQTEGGLRHQEQEEASQVLVDELKSIRTDLTAFIESSSAQIVDFKTGTETEIQIQTQKLDALIKQSEEFEDFVKTILQSRTIVEIETEDDDAKQAMELKDYCLRQFERLNDKFVMQIKPMSSTLDDLMSKNVELKMRINDLNEEQSKSVKDHQDKMEELNQLVKRQSADQDRKMKSIQEELNKEINELS